MNSDHIKIFKSNSQDKSEDHAPSEYTFLKANSEELHEQKVPKEMMKKFHKSMKLCIYQYTVL